VNLATLYFGFHTAGFRNEHGRIDPRCWFGHVEVWGHTHDSDWVFIDPAGAGMKITVLHHHDDVVDALTWRMNACDSILRLPGQAPSFTLPLHGLMTCASIAGQIASVRALLPHTLKAKLLRKGAEVIHEKQDTERGPGCESATRA
jgi:hypothetical protein